MSRLVLIDGNSILNRAFYGIMGNKMLTTRDGKYTNAVYGFILGIIGVNGIPEAIVAAVITLILGKTLMRKGVRERLGV